jgi:hypothetical protein
MKVAGEGTLPAAPCDITAEGKVVGTLGSSLGKRGLAEVRLDFAEEAHAAGKPMLAGDVHVRLLRPVWAAYGEAFAMAEG